MAWVKPLEDQSDTKLTSIDNIPLHDHTHIRKARNLQTNLSVVPESANEPESIAYLPAQNDDPDIDIGEDSESENQTDRHEIEDVSKNFIRKLSFNRNELLRKHYGITQTDESMLKEVLHHFKEKKREEDQSRMLSQVQCLNTFGAKAGNIRQPIFPQEKTQLSSRCLDFYKPKHHSKKSTVVRSSLPNPPTIVLNLSINSTKPSKKTPTNFPKTNQKSKKSLDPPEDTALASRASNLYSTVPRDRQESFAQKQLSDQLTEVSNKIESLIGEVCLIRDNYRKRNTLRKESFISQLSLVEDTIRDRSDTALRRYRDSRHNKENSGFLN